MRFKLCLQANRGALLPFNYQYPLSAAIYKIIQKADDAFAAFLHNQGYGKEHKSFKLFTFSDIKTPFVRKGDRMQLQTGEAELLVCFYMPIAAENFIKGLFINQELEIADHYSKVIFHIRQVESVADTNVNSRHETILLHPLSPIVAGKKNEQGHYDYRSPEDTDFTECLLHNWIEKYTTIHTIEADLVNALKKHLQMQVKLFPHPPQQRLITIKGGTRAETKIRGYTKFRLQVRAPKELMELALGAGIGLHNAQGMGCVGVV
jgi:CRISPR-associated endoribonuclease Cas6